MHDGIDPLNAILYDDRGFQLRACEEMPVRYAHSLKGPDTARHSREGGNPVRSLRRITYVLDSRLRGNDALAAFFHKFSVAKGLLLI